MDEVIFGTFEICHDGWWIPVEFEALKAGDIFRKNGGYAAQVTTGPVPCPPEGNYELMCIPWKWRTVIKIDLSFIARYPMLAGQALTDILRNGQGTNIVVTGQRNKIENKIQSK